ncbi:MAG: hypothetical protein CR991_04280 [Proteobacteria bacterium]|nr:MAG: hypothetical protein CR991_04280 [Pseudomonadota bacterium]
MNAEQQPSVSKNNKQQNKLGSIESARHFIATIGERVRSGELRARLQYFLFKQTQQAKESNSLLSKYQYRLKEDWPTWLGVACGISGLLMLFSPEKLWFWQIPLIILLTFLAPAFFELPATLKSLFSHTAYQHLVGQVITLTHSIVDGKGRTALDGREWLVSGPDCAMGSKVKIVTLDAKTLYVIPDNPKHSKQERLT